MNELHRKVKSKGLVVLGIHTTRGAENMADFVKKAGIEYPVVADLDGLTVKKYHVDSFPDYYIIDKAGNLRFADIANAEIDRAIFKLLKEKTPEKAEVVDARMVLKNAQERARKENKKLLVHLGAPW